MNRRIMEICVVYWVVKRMQALIGLFPPRNTLANIFAHDGPLIWDDVKMRVEIIPCVLQMKKHF
ncbi:hypothetical protein T08_3685 [Trichinella sp. T8]|nr:hypothetical protein T08_3685 [Trichinella sp. T8]